LNKNKFTGLFAVILGIVYSIGAVNLRGPSMGDPLGPKVFPLVIGTFSILFGVLLILREMRVPKERRDEISFQLSVEGKKILKLILLTSVFGIIYGLFFDSLGYLISTTIFMIFVMFLVNKSSRWVQNIIVSLGFSVITYVGFATLLHLSLPRGILNF
jgi:putative tricarboxylic transport membrane protein